MEANQHLDYHKEAYVITGITTTGKEMYYVWEDGEFDFDSCVFYANLYNTIDEARTFMRNIVAEREKYPHIQSIWIEKLTTIPCEDNYKTSL